MNAWNRPGQVGFVAKAAGITPLALKRRAESKGPKWEHYKSRFAKQGDRDLAGNPFASTVVVLYWIEGEDVGPRGMAVVKKTEEERMQDQLRHKARVIEMQRARIGRLEQELEDARSQVRSLQAEVKG